MNNYVAFLLSYFLLPYIDIELKKETGVKRYTISIYSFCANNRTS